MKCRHCQSELTLPLIDLGAAPPSNALLTPLTLLAPEKHFPLRVWVCEQCWLAQTEDYAGADELFSSDYAYFSSYSTTWLQHAQRYAALMRERWCLNAQSYWVEVAANDGYLLHYVQQLGIPCLGIEPTASTAKVARSKGIPIIEAFFGVELAHQLVQAGHAADLITANNVLAHVPNINDFVAGFAVLLKPEGVVTFEFPHLLNLVQQNQFDTIYHEHYSYLSLSTVQRILRAAGLGVFDVETLPTHGGSLRVYAQRADTGQRAIEATLGELLAQEKAAGVNTTGFYARLQSNTQDIKNNLWRFLLQAQHEGKCVVAYGAAAKGNTLLNYAGVRPDLLPFVVDRNPSKQGKFLPASRIPIVDETRLKQAQPHYVLILPWNLQDEVVRELSYIRDWGGAFVVAVPALKVLP